MIEKVSIKDSRAVSRDICLPRIIDMGKFVAIVGIDVGSCMGTFQATRVGHDSLYKYIHLHRWGCKSP